MRTKLKLTTVVVSVENRWLTLNWPRTDQAPGTTGETWNDPLVTTGHLPALNGRTLPTNRNRNLYWLCHYGNFDSEIIHQQQLSPNSLFITGIYFQCKDFWKLIGDYVTWLYASFWVYTCMRNHFDHVLLTLMWVEKNLTILPGKKRNKTFKIVTLQKWTHFLSKKVHTKKSIYQ